MADDKTTKTPEQPVTDSGPGKETPPAPQKEPEKVSVSPEPGKKTEPEVKTPQVSVYNFAEIMKEKKAEERAAAPGVEKPDPAKTEKPEKQPEAPKKAEEKPKEPEQPKRRGRPPKADKDKAAAPKPKAPAQKPEKAVKKEPEKKAAPTVQAASAPKGPEKPKDAPRRGKEQIVYIKLNELHAFKNHPFEVRDDEEMRAMVSSVKDKGVTQPAIVRPREDGGYHNEELKSLTRYRFGKVNERAQLKQSVSRLVNILFPELETLVPSLHMASVYAMLAEFPSARQIADAHLTHFKAVLTDASRGRYDRDKAVEIREAARRSVGSAMPAKSLELQHTIRLIRELDKEIDEIEAAIKAIIDEMAPPILTIPGISYRMGAMILAEIGDFSRFDSSDKLLAYAGLSPSTYESGKLKATGTYAHMEKRGSRYLRYALFNATKFVCHWEPSFAAYLARKRAEGKHYNVAISHAAKKLVRLIFALQTSGKAFQPT